MKFPFISKKYDAISWIKKDIMKFLFISKKYDAITFIGP